VVLAPRSRFTLEDFQRSSDENKQIWWSFADSQGSGRDLAWYEEGLLQACLAEHGIDGVQGTAEQNFANGEVIIKIKAFQRSARPPPPWGGREEKRGRGLKMLSQNWTPTEAVSSRRQFGAFQVWAQELIGNKQLFRTVRLAASIIDSCKLFRLKAHLNAHVMLRIGRQARMAQTVLGILHAWSEPFLRAGFHARNVYPELQAQLHL